MSLVAPLTATDLGTALRCIGGLAKASINQFTRMNVKPLGASAGRLDMADALRIARKVAGLEANP